MSKTIAVHQPNFLPWIGFFHKILHSDIFVIFDEVQFVRRSVCNRNKIKSVQGKELIITIPVKTSNGSRLSFRALEIDYNQKWARKILNSLEHSYKKTKYYSEFFDELSKIINTVYPNLAELNITLINYILNKLEIQTKIYYQSELDGDFGHKNELIINICKYFNADIYLSGQGAKKYNCPLMFEKEKIKLTYQDFQPPIYEQIYGDFLPNLSIIDLLFNCGSKKSKEILLSVNSAN